jgi:hypothetical protein
MAHGGARPGSGRPKNAPNKATAKRQQEVASTGTTPLDFLLQTMRDPNIDPVLRFNAAKAAAPYVHPGLSSIEVGNKDGKAFKVFNLQAGDEEL